MPECGIDGQGLVALVEAMTILTPAAAGAQLRHLDARLNPLGEAAVERCEEILREKRKFPLTLDMRQCDEAGGRQA